MKSEGTQITCEICLGAFSVTRVGAAAPDAEWRGLPDVGRPPYLWVLPFEISEWFPNNVARNSPAHISSFEIGSLKFRGFLDA